MKTADIKETRLPSGDANQHDRRKSGAVYEIILAILIIALMLLPQLIGTTSVADETAGVDMTVTYGGEDRDPLTAADELSLSLLRLACPDMEYAYDEGKCMIRGRISTEGTAQQAETA